MQTTPFGLSPARLLLFVTLNCTLAPFYSCLATDELELERHVVRGLCQAQCLSRCFDFQNEDCNDTCVGPPDQNVIPEYIDWTIDCTEPESNTNYRECVGTCSNTNETAGYVPAKPEVMVSMDASAKFITLEWIPDTSYSLNTIYVVSQLSAGKEGWEQLGMVTDGVFPVGPIKDLCSTPMFRVAAVNRFGSRWFSNQTGVPGMIPGRPGNIHLERLEYEEGLNDILYTLRWLPPEGWAIKDLETEHHVTYEMTCGADPWEKVYFFTDNFALSNKRLFDGTDVDSFTMKGRITVNAIGCIVTFRISAVSRCNKTWVGPPSEISLDFKCQDLPGYKGPYCTTPPVLRPGPVSQLKLILIPHDNGIIGLVSWQPPRDMGSAGMVSKYHVFYGIVDLQSSGLIKRFKGPPWHKSVNGTVYSMDIYLNITTLKSYETVGVMVRAAGPGQIIESPFGDIIFADNHFPPIHPRAGQVITKDDTIIVVASPDSQDEHQHSGMGVEIFWRRPNQALALNITSYVLKYGVINNTTDHDFQPGTVNVTATDGI